MNTVAPPTVTCVGIGMGKAAAVQRRRDEFHTPLTTVLERFDRSFLATFLHAD